MREAQGLSSVKSLVSFAGIPTGLAATGAFATRRARRGFLVLQAAVLVIATVWLLERIGCLS